MHMSNNCVLSRQKSGPFYRYKSQMQNIKHKAICETINKYLNRKCANQPNTKQFYLLCCCLVT